MPNDYSLGTSLPENLNPSAEAFQIYEAVGYLNKENKKTDVPVFDPNDQSSLVFLRKKIEELYREKKVPKGEKLGIVLSVEDEVDIDNNQLSLKVYAEVPYTDSNGVVSQDFINVGNNEDDLEHKAFYAISDKVAKEERPHPGDIVRVELPEDYFFSKVTNPRNNRYLGVFNNRIIAPPAPQSEANNKKVDSEAKLPLEKTSIIDSLFKYSPKQAIDSSDLVSLPFDGDFVAVSLPATRPSPPGSAAAVSGQQSQDHVAVDFAMQKGTPIYACADHELIPTNYNGPTSEKPNAKPGYGNYIRAKNEKFMFVYGHLDQKVLPSDGKKYKKGDLVGYSGDSGKNPPYGPHLHFEVFDLNTRKKISALYLLKGKIKINDEMKKRFSFTTNTLKLPLPFDANKENIGIIDLSAPPSKIPNSPPAVAQAPNVPTSKPAGSSAKAGGSASKPTSKPKLSLVRVETDLSTNVSLSNKKGTKVIKVREDIAPKIQKIKDYLNNYLCNFSCNYLEVAINNKKISNLARVGLEIQLNNNAGLSLSSNVDFDDYLIGPDYSKPLGAGYKLKVYAVARRNIILSNNLYNAENRLIDIYDIKSTYLKNKPKVIQVFKRVLDLTQIMEDFGFVQILPLQEFFINSDYKRSNWWIFYNPNKIIKGYSYRELLSTVYDENNESIWKEKELFWNGSSFS